MARARLIKPEFWASDQVASCSRDARLLFIGLWTFSDCGGVHPASTTRLKREVFPDDQDITPARVGELVAELCEARDELGVGLVGRFEAPDGKHYWFCPHWADHQHLKHPSRRYPSPPPPGGLPPSSPPPPPEEKRREEKRKERNPENAPPAPFAAALREVENRMALRKRQKAASKAVRSTRYAN